jgi:uncharacterized membrane protein
VVLAVLIAWSSGTLASLVVVREEKGRDDRSDAGALLPAAGADAFAVLLIGVALILTLVPEFVYLRDLFGTRMNTVFKFYYQAWAMLAVGSAYGLSRLAERGTPFALKLPALVLAGFLLLGGLWYPVAAIPYKADGFRSTATLDGLAYIRQADPAEMAAIEWLRSSAAPDAVVVEASGGSYEEVGGIPANRVSMVTGNPTLLGWDFHERQWRGGAFERLAGGRLEVLDQIYRSARAEQLPALLDHWGVDYVFVGSVERRKYGMGDALLARFDRALQLVYERDGVRIYAR